ncbi:hypothetical protein GPJ56_003548 [Histomonas meleagridis]|uniref:uncharacterized protein n=1 Tax=Histomonas meleagridis TaxID=135588 RepID=UPI00355A9659|nr:hypothetical protein GPJ56_003548 [Histomonas meleagridis]KAH0806434.1 hypothetical protein GO595_000809 [Histomonas meleagridis]
MLTVFLYLASLTAPKYITISVSDFYQMEYEMNTQGTSYAVEPSNYNINKTVYVMRESGEREDGSNYTSYKVTGTTQELAELRASLNLISDPISNISDYTQQGYTVKFIFLEKAASFSQMSTFWVNIVVWIIFIAAALSGYLIWHFDNYSKDPRNSLLFVTEGNRIVTGE